MKYCRVCNEPIVGRIDKKYCSPKCRSANDYEKRLDDNPFFYTVDKILKSNRKILKQFNKSGFTTLRKEKLIKEGFNPKFFTHYWKNKKGQVYLFCFEFGFLEIKKEGVTKYLLVEWQDYMK